MSEDIDAYIGKGDAVMQKTIDHLASELQKIRAGKASPKMLDGIVVDYYGSPTPLNQVANVGLADSKTITIQAWEKKLLPVIEQAIFKANLGLTPMNDGEFVRISIPPLTEDRRKDLVKQSKALGEDAKVGLRNARQKMMDFIKKEVKDGYPEDMGKRKEGDVQGLVKKFSDTIDRMIEAKEKDIMTV
ncbi:MAG: ribosome recycling factor [Bacteroidota bacterium]